jgi:hypothetical protein
MKAQNFLTVLSFLLFANYVSFAQDCNTFFNYKKGTILKLQSFNAKDKPTSSIVQTCKEVNVSGKMVNVVILSESFDDKNKKLGEATVQVVCEGGSIKFDMKNFAMQNLPDMKGNSEVKIEITGDQLDLPSNLEVGQTLKNVSYNLKSSMGSMTIMNRTFNIRERKVEGKEEISTPAGKFDCFKVSYLTDFEGLFGKKMTYKTLTWYAANVGTVRTESYNEKEKLTSYTMLTEVK